MKKDMFKVALRGANARTSSIARMGKVALVGAMLALNASCDQVDDTVVDEEKPDTDIPNTDIPAAGKGDTTFHFSDIPSLLDAAARANTVDFEKYKVLLQPESSLLIDSASMAATDGLSINPEVSVGWDAKKGISAADINVDYTPQRHINLRKPTLRYDVRKKFRVTEADSIALTDMGADGNLLDVSEREVPFDLLQTLKLQDVQLPDSLHLLYQIPGETDEEQYYNSGKILEQAARHSVLNSKSKFLSFIIKGNLHVANSYALDGFCALIHLAVDNSRKVFFDSENDGNITYSNSRIYDNFSSKQSVDFQLNRIKEDIAILNAQGGQQISFINSIPKGLNKELSSYAMMFNDTSSIIRHLDSSFHSLNITKDGKYFVNDIPATKLSADPGNPVVAKSSSTKKPAVALPFPVWASVLPISKRVLPKRSEQLGEAVKCLERGGNMINEIA